MQLVTLGIIVLLLTSSTALANTRNPFGCERTPVSIGISETGVMYHDGQGADPDLVALISEQTGCQFKIIPIARENAFGMIERGEIDIFTTAARTPEREAFAWFIPYFEIKFLLLTNAQRLPDITSMEALEDVEGATIARTAGGGYGSYFNFQLSEMEARGMVRFYATYGESVTALLNGEVDATLSVPQIYRLFFDKNAASLPLNIRDVAPTTASPISLMLGKQRFNSAQAANWLRLIESLRLDGSIEAILANYVTAEEAATMMGRAFYHASSRPGAANE